MSNIRHLSAHIPDCTIADRPASEQLAHVQNLTQLERLVIDSIIYSETTVEQLIDNIKELKQLKSLKLYTNCETPLDRAFLTLATDVNTIEELYLKVNCITMTTIEALSYCPNLRVFDFGLWKPFETGCLTLSLECLQYCPRLQVLDK